MIGDKRVLAAGTAMLLFGGSATSVLAQTPVGQQGAPATPAQGGGVDRPGLALGTEAAGLFARDRNISVQQRPREGYEARGLRMGAFLAYPKATVTAEANDNIFATDQNEVDDLVWRITPEVSLASDWSRHALGAYARAVLNRYQDFDSENTTDYGAGVNGKLDLLRFTNIRGSFDWANLTEPRTSPDSPGLAAKPVEYDLSTLRVAGEHTVNRLRFQAGYMFQRFDYESPPRIGGGIVEQTFRDRNINTFNGRVDYAVSPDTALFFEVVGNNRNYDFPGSATALNRDSDGIQFLAGANFELGAVTRGEIAAGYLEQDFDDPSLDKIDGFGARAQVEWFPTQLTTVTFNGSRSVEDSSTPGVGAYLSSNIGVIVDHELMRNVILTARAAYGEDDYDEINRKDERQTAGISATYLLNRSVGISAGWAYDRRDTVKGVGDSFKQNKISATLTAQF